MASPSNKVISNLVDIGKLKSRQNASLVQITRLGDLLIKEKEKLESIEKNYESHSEALAIAQEDIDRNYLPEGAMPAAVIQNRDKLRMKTKQIELALHSQRTCVEKAKEALRLAEKSRFEADKDLNQYVDKLEETNIALEERAALDKEKTDRLARLEVKRARKWEQEQKAAIDDQANRVRELRDLAMTQMTNAKKYHNEAADRIADSNADTYKITNKIREMKEQEATNRVEAVLQLKASQDAVRADIAQKAARYVRKMDKAKKQLENEKADMVSRGLNPYAEFRQAEIDGDAAAREKRLTKAVDVSQAEIAQRMLKDEELRRKETAKQRKEKDYEKRYRDELGRHVVDEKNRQYIIATTSDHREVLDPTGSEARIEPSKITDIPDKSFGLANSARIPAQSMRRITEGIRQKLKVDRDDLGEYQRLVAGLLPEKGGDDEILRSRSAPGSHIDSDKGDEDRSKDKEKERLQKRKLTTLRQLASVNGPIPGIDDAARAVNFDDEEAEVTRLMKIAEEEPDGIETPAKNSAFNEKSPKYKPIPKSKFEQDSFDKAKTKQKERLLQGTTQIAGGRVFEGSAFVSKPAELEYIDFEVGKIYKKKFTLTNVSYTFNSFRLTALPDDIVDFFEINYEKPGRMSAGVSCSLEIVFTPKLNRDITTGIKLITETGPVEIPLRCRIRKCLPALSTSTVNCGQMFIGQTSTTTMKIKNHGAIPSKFSIVRLTDSSSSDAVDATGPTDAEEDVITSEPALQEGELMARVQRTITTAVRQKRKANPFPISLLTAGVVDGYSETTVTVLAAPLSVGYIEQNFAVRFDGVRDVDTTGNGLDPNAVAGEQRLNVLVTADDIPISLAEEVVDLKCTLFDRIYRRKIELRNRATTACKVSVKVAPPMNRYVEFSPSMVFVQGEGSSIFNLKFSPVPEMMTRLAHYCVLREGFEDAALMALPVEIKVVNQELPVYLTLRCDICRSSIQLSTTDLNFGEVYVSQQLTGRLTLRNMSRLAQKIAFVNLKREVVVRPNQGFISLLPGESAECDILFTPQACLSYDFDICIKTSLNDVYNVKIKAEAIDPPVVIEDTMLQMRVTCPGERVVARSRIRNNTNVTQIAEVGYPDTRFSWLRVGPAVLEIKPSESATVEFVFVPPENAMDLDPQVLLQDENSAAGNPFDEINIVNGWLVAKGLVGEVRWRLPSADTSGPEPGEEDSVDTSQSQDRNTHIEWAVVGEWHLPVWFKPQHKKSTSVNAQETTSNPSPKLLPMFISIKTTVSEPELTADEKTVDFGQSAIGIRQVKTVKIFNRSDRRIPLVASGLNCIGPFTVLNVLREVEPNGWQQLRIECRPQHQGLVLECLTLSSPDGGQELRINLKSQGVKPSVDIAGLSPGPPSLGPKGGILDFGNVVINDVVKKKFTIQNTSSFVVKSSICRSLCDGLPIRDQEDFVQRTSAGLPLFSFRPESAVIESGSSAEIEVVFRPDHGQHRPYREDILVKIGLGDDLVRISLCGRAWSRQLFMTPADPRDDIFVKKAGEEEVEDPHAGVFSSDVRRLVAETNSSLGIKETVTPLVLEYLDPYAKENEKLFDEETNNAAAAAAAASAAASAAAASASASAAAASASAAPGKKAATKPAQAGGGRSQVKGIVLHSGVTSDARQTQTAPGSFEIILDKDAKDSGFFSLSLDKGPIAVGASVAIDVTCTLPRPKGVSGLEVGSWNRFSAKVCLKGGWRPDGEPEEVVLPVELKAFLRL